MFAGSDGQLQSCYLRYIAEVFTHEYCGVEGEERAHFRLDVGGLVFVHSEQHLLP